MDSYFSEEELSQIGFLKFGKNVKISRKSSIYSAEKISLGSNVRVDDFCILSGLITIGDYVHINPYNGIFAGDEGVTLEDFVNLSSKITIYAVSDDYSGTYLTTPLIPDSRQYLTKSPVIIKKYVVIGTGSSVLPGVIIEEGCAIGAMSLVRSNTDAWGIYAGNPLKFIRARKKELLDYLPDDKKAIS